jgi:hypothetical protein
MSMPNPKEGLQAKARVMVQQSLKVLDAALKAFDAGSKEFQVIHSAYKSLGKAFGTEESQELTDAGLKQIAGAISPKGMSGMQQAGGSPMGGPSPMPMGGM